MVLARCQRVLVNSLDAEDACQDALIAISRRIGSFEGRSRFTTWLYPVVMNAAIDTYRRLRRRASVAGTDDALAGQAADAHTSVQAGARVDILDALDHVDPRFAEPVLLRDLYQLDYAEIAEQLGVPVGTVKSRIHEGRKTLQYLLERD